MQLPVRTKPRKKLASRARVPAIAPTRPNERWTMDFVSARTSGGRWFRTLTIVDIYTREALALVVDRSLTGVKVAAALSRILQQRPKPQAISMDYGPEFVACAILRWLEASAIETAFIDPGKPWQNGADESFNGKLRDEYLTLQWFRNRVDARVGVEQWRRHYNEVRPHSSLGYLTPAEFKASGAATITVGRSAASPPRADQEDRRPDEDVTFTDRLTGAIFQ